VSSSSLDDSSNAIYINLPTEMSNGEWETFVDWIKNNKDELDIIK